MSKIDAVWQWEEGQLARGYLVIDGNDTGRFDYRVTLVVENTPFATWEGKRYDIRGASPVISDRATSDGLLRTARAAWGNPKLHVQPVLDFNDFTRVARWDVHGAPRCGGKTEKDALLDAIGKAP